MSSFTLRGIRTTQRCVAFASWFGELSRLHTMHLRFNLPAAALALLLSACEKPAAPTPEAPAKPAVVSPPPAPKPEAPKETAEELKKLQGKLPRMDPEKAKFIAVPSTPSDPKPEKPEEIKKPAEVKKAEPAK